MKNIVGFVIFLTVILLLSGCSKSGIEEISPKEAHDKLKNPKNEYVIAISDLSRAGEEHIYNSKKILEKVAEEQGITIYYTIYNVKNDKHQKDWNENGEFLGDTSRLYFAKKGKKIDDMDYQDLAVKDTSNIELAISKLNKFIEGIEKR